MSTIATIGALALDQAALRARLEGLTRQVSTGMRGERHGDLGTEARRAVDLRGEIARREAASAAADRALGRADVTQDVLGRLHELAGNVAAEAARARTLGGMGLDPLAQTARAALAEAAALLNTRHRDEYLFSGSEVGQPPVTNLPALTGSVQAAVAALDPVNAPAVLAATAAAASAPATTPFANFLETPPGLTEARRAVQVADGERVGIGVFANRDHAGEVTRSWGRELLRGLATLAALTPAQAAQGPGYDALLEGVARDLADAAAGLASEAGALGAAEARIEATRERHADTLVALRAQLGDVEEVDLAAATAVLRAVQARLEASYETTGMIARLSLAAMLP